MTREQIMIGRMKIQFMLPVVSSRPDMDIADAMRLDMLFSDAGRVLATADLNNQEATIAAISDTDGFRIASSNFALPDSFIIRMIESAKQVDLIDEQELTCPMDGGKRDCKNCDVARQTHPC